MQVRPSLEKLKKRRELVGSIGAIDFLIDLESRRPRSRDLQGQRRTPVSDHLASSDAISRRSEYTDSRRGVFRYSDASKISGNKTIPKDATKGLSRIIRLNKLLKLGFVKRPLAELSLLFDQEETEWVAPEAAWLFLCWKIDMSADGDHREIEAALSVIEGSRPTFVGDSAFAVMLSDYYCQFAPNSLHMAEDLCKTAINKRPGLVDPRLSLSNVYARLASLDSSKTEEVEPQRLQLMNEAFAVTGLEPVQKRTAREPLSLDNICVNPELIPKVSGPLVSVIMPARDSAEHIGTAIDSVLSQSWRNVELIVIDDCSGDNTNNVAQEFARLDDRVTIIRNATTRGPYYCRNLGLLRAAGLFATVHDSDDWSHPRKIEMQVSALLSDHSLIATQSDHVRSRDDLVFRRRGRIGQYIFPNMSSLMFWRQRVLSRVGCWDQVCFGADSEFLRRLKLLFGASSVRTVPTGIVSIARMHMTSLTASGASTYNGYTYGARLFYQRAADLWHSREKTPRLGCNEHQRPFPVPSVMLPTEQSAWDRRNLHAFDVIIASDFRLAGGTTASNIEEVKAQRRAGLRTGLLQLNTYRIHPDTQLNHKLVDLVDGDLVDWISQGPTYRTRSLTLRFPPAIADEQVNVPTVQTDTIRVICNQSPLRGLSRQSERLYDPVDVDRNISQLWGCQPLWYPIGPSARSGLEADRADVRISNDDWVNIIDVDEWSDGRTGPVSYHKPTIGRHGRDHRDKWPAEKRTILQAYPESDHVDVSILGGARFAIEHIGHKPRNWAVYEFGSLDPKEYLRSLDVFVYFPHEDWNEAFGRTVFEAMAVGVPVVLPDRFRKTFRNYALYCKPNEVLSLVLDLYSDTNMYWNMIQRASDFVRKEFGYDKHLRRLLD